MKSRGYLAIISITSFVAVSLFVTGCSSKMINSNLNTSSPSTTMDFINLNTADNRQVLLNLPNKWAATKQVYTFADSFEYIQNKNKGIRNGLTYTIFDDEDGMSIGIELRKEKDIFNETWSPDRRTIVYGKGNNNEGLGKIFIWRVGEEKPSQIVPNDTGYPIGNFSWSPNSEFFTIRIAVAPESGGYLIRVDDQKTTRILCFMEPFFSADSKFLLFSGLENIQSTYKVAGSGVSVNISLMDLNTLKTSVLIPSTNKINYTSLGWAGTNKVMYRKYDLSTKTDEILEYDFKQNPS